MQVYTFSTGGCREGVYLNKLSKTKQGVKKLLRNYIEKFYTDDEQSVRDIFIDDKLITVIIDDLVIKKSFNRVFELIIFDCV